MKKDRFQEQLSLEEQLNQITDKFINYLAEHDISGNTLDMIVSNFENLDVSQKIQYAAHRRGIGKETEEQIVEKKDDKDDKEERRQQGFMSMSKTEQLRYKNRREASKRRFEVNMTGRRQS